MLAAAHSSRSDSRDSESAGLRRWERCHAYRVAGGASESASPREGCFRVVVFPAMASWPCGWSVRHFLVAFSFAKCEGTNPISVGRRPLPDPPLKGRGIVRRLGRFSGSGGKGAARADGDGCGHSDMVEHMACMAQGAGGEAVQPGSSLTALPRLVAREAASRTGYTAHIA